MYRCDADGVPGFIEAGAPTDDELDALLHTIIARLMKMLTRRGVLVADMGQTYLAEPDADGEEARTLRPLQAAAITYRNAFGPRAGQKVLTLSRNRTENGRIQAVAPTGLMWKPSAAARRFSAAMLRSRCCSS